MERRDVFRVIDRVANMLMSEKDKGARTDDERWDSMGQVVWSPYLKVNHRVIAKGLEIDISTWKSQTIPDADRIGLIDTPGKKVSVLNHTILKKEGHRLNIEFTCPESPEHKTLPQGATVFAPLNTGYEDNALIELLDMFPTAMFPRKQERNVKILFLDKDTPMPRVLDILKIKNVLI
jgi:hypothetical protein